jgi:hypothetical protein
LNYPGYSVSIEFMYDPDDHKILRKLLDLFGEPECLRLGFLGKDDNATLYVSPKGLGYLLDVIAAELASLPEAYAAGYDQGYTLAKDGF